MGGGGILQGLKTLIEKPGWLSRIMKDIDRDQQKYHREPFR